MTVERGNKLYEDGLTSHCSGRGNSGASQRSSSRQRLVVGLPPPLSTSVIQSKSVDEGCPNEMASQHHDLESIPIGSFESILSAASLCFRRWRKEY